MTNIKTIFDVTIGSTVYGTNTPTSDIDNKAIHITDINSLYINKFDGQINYNKDSVSYELSRFLELIAVNNPTCLEMLFTPEKHIREIHPAFQILIDNRHKFLTKKCKDTFGGYVRSQIMKATALDKKMNWERDRVERKDVLDFCYTFYNQGSTKIKNWLEYRGLKQKYCGLVNIPNMHDVYGVHYDLGNHIANESELPSDEFLESYLGISKHFFRKENIKDVFEGLQSEDTFVASLSHALILRYSCGNHSFSKDELVRKINPIGYKGMVGEDGLSNEVRLSSIGKHSVPICNMTWNKTGYIKHCKDYKEYTKWLNERNTQRYVDTKTHGQMIDGKNMLHCRRLLDMAIEIAETGDIVLERPNAKELLDIRLGKVDLESIVNDAVKDLEKLNEIYEKSDLPDTIDTELLDKLHYEIRKTIYETW